jgi:hypothetical protein
VFQMHILVFHLPSLYVATIASEYFKSRSGLHMECTWEAGDGAGDVRGGTGDV